MRREDIWKYSKFTIEVLNNLRLNLNLAFEMTFALITFYWSARTANDQDMTEYFNFHQNVITWFPVSFFKALTVLLRIVRKNFTRPRDISRDLLPQLDIAILLCIKFRFISILFAEVIPNIHRFFLLIWCKCLKTNLIFFAENIEIHISNEGKNLHFLFPKECKPCQITIRVSFFEIWSPTFFF